MALVNLDLKVECGGKGSSTYDLATINARLQQLRGKHDAESIREWEYLRHLKRRLKREG